MHPSPDDVPVTAHAADVARTVAFRRSLRATSERRHTAALRRRRLARGRRSLAVAAAGLAILSAGALADSTGGAAPIVPDLTKQAIRAAQRALGLAPDGVVGPGTRRATRRFQRRNGIEVDGVLGPATMQALGVGPTTTPAALAIGPDDAATLQRIAQCESQGDPTAISADERYRGKYQFDRRTWRSVGGRGDPVDAPEAEQDRRALALLRRDGTTPWPDCA